MRLINLILSEFRFLWKYGIIALYGIFTGVYLCLLAAIPASARGLTAGLLIFTDPAAMGLFFMGAVVLLEKSQHVESALSVSPIKIEEYIIAKILPMTAIGCIVATILGLYADRNILLVILGVFFSSILFSLCGLSIGANIKSLNGFMLATVPVEIILFIPPILYVFGIINKGIWLCHPGVSAIYLISGENKKIFLAILSIIGWSILTFLTCKKSVAKSFVTLGGIKL